jgi:hypothetical protein
MQEVVYRIRLKEKNARRPDRRWERTTRTPSLLIPFLALFWGLCVSLPWRRAGGGARHHLRVTALAENIEVGFGIRVDG